MGTFYSNNDYRDYLSHHGIKNQRWGVRHGPPYPLDDKESRRIQKRRGDVNYFNKDKTVKYRPNGDRPNEKEKKTSLNSKSTETLGKASVNAVRSARNIQQNIRQKKIEKQTNDYRHEIENLSDYDLRKIVNRKTMEQQYNDIRNREEVKIGKDVMGDALFYAVELTSVAASVATIAVILKNLK